MEKIFSIPMFRSKISKPYHYRENEIVCTESSYCSQVGFIIKGELELIHYTLHGDEVTLATLKENNMFGDFLVFTDQPFYPGTLVVKKAAVIRFLDRDKLNALLRESEQFRQLFLTHISQKAMTMNRQNKLLLQPTIREKVHYYIAREATTYKPKVRYKNKTALAKTMNVQRPSLVRELKKMKAEGVIDYDASYLWFVQR